MTYGTSSAPFAADTIGGTTGISQPPNALSVAMGAAPSAGPAEVFQYPERPGRALRGGRELSEHGISIDAGVRPR